MFCARAYIYVEKRREEFFYQSSLYVTGFFISTAHVTSSVHACMLVTRDPVFMPACFRLPDGGLFLLLYLLAHLVGC